VENGFIGIEIAIESAIAIESDSEFNLKLFVSEGRVTSIPIPIPIPILISIPISIPPPSSFLETRLHQRATQHHKTPTAP